MNTPPPLISLTNVCRKFNTGSLVTEALADVTLSINEGDYVSISGPSGCGKSTLLSILGLLDRPTAGTYAISGVEVSELSASAMAQVRNREIGFVFQDFNLIGDMTVFENVELPLIYGGIAANERKERVARILDRVNMTPRTHHLPMELSGGQQQRVAVARALAGGPSLLLADEPTGNLDSENGDTVMQLLTELNDDGVTICMVTHDSRYAGYARTTLQLFDGRLTAESIAEVA